jgi:hypothetical protein
MKSMSIDTSTSDTPWAWGPATSTAIKPVHPRPARRPRVDQEEEEDESVISIDIIYIDAALAAGNKKCGRHLGPVILLIALQQKTQDDSTVQHVPAQIGGPYSGGFTFHK